MKVVKKNEMINILRFRLLNYLGLADNPRDFEASRLDVQPNMNSLHLSVVALFLRSSFFDNAYVLNSLIRRASEGFLRNGSPVTSNVICGPWDILAVAHQF